MPCRDVGLPRGFQADPSRGVVLAVLGLTDQAIARRVTGWVTAMDSVNFEYDVSQRPD